jgi:FixJ family two-component response regulator
MTVKAMKAGAVEFLTKPVREQDLLDAVRSHSHGTVPGGSRRERLRPCARAFPVIDGPGTTGAHAGYRRLTNNNVAAEIDVSEITVKLYRRSLTTKTGAKTFAELVRMADAIELHLPTRLSL